MPTYDKRSKSIQNSQYIGIHEEGLKFGHEIAYISNEKSRMRATDVNHQRNNTIDPQDHSRSLYAASDHQSKLQALKDIDPEIKRALNNAKIDRSGHSLLQSMTDR